MGASFSLCDSLPSEQSNAAPSTAHTSSGSDKPKLPQPLKYEELQREAYGVGSKLADACSETVYAGACSLKWESIEGMKFDINKPLNPNFFLSHRMALGMQQVGESKSVRTPAPSYNFSATVANEKFLLMGTMMHDGVLMSKAVYRPSEYLSTKFESRVDPASYSNVVYMMDMDLSQPEWLVQIKKGMGGFYGANAMLSVTPRISGGAEFFYLQPQKRSGVGFAMRYVDAKAIATAQVATTGVVSTTYLHRISEKATMAADFLYNLNQREAVASVGYDYTFKQCRLRGCVDSDFKVAAFLEEQLGPGIKLLLSGELDHARGDHKFGFGMTVGE